MIISRHRDVDNNLTASLCQTVLRGLHCDGDQSVSDNGITNGRISSDKQLAVVQEKTIPTWQDQGFNRKIADQTYTVELLRVHR